MLSLPFDIIKLISNQVNDYTLLDWVDKNKINWYYLSKNPLAIQAIHLLEKNLDYLGIDNYVCLNRPEVTEWNHIYKITWLLDYLKSRNCKEDLILYCDPADTIFIDLSYMVEDRFSDIFASIPCFLRIGNA